MQWKQTTVALHHTVHTRTAIVRHTPCPLTWPATDSRHAHTCVPVCAYLWPCGTCRQHEIRKKQKRAKKLEYPYYWQNSLRDTEIKTYHVTGIQSLSVSDYMADYITDRIPSFKARIYIYVQTTSKVNNDLPRCRNAQPLTSTITSLRRNLFTSDRAFNIVTSDKYVPPKRCEGSVTRSRRQEIKTLLPPRPTSPLKRQGNTSRHVKARGVALPPCRKQK